MLTTDEDLLERVRQTDAHDAWQVFYNQYWNAILRYSRKLGLDERHGEDVLQESMVTLMRILPAFEYDRSKGKFRNFLLTIVHRKALAVMRRQRRERETFSPWEDHHDEKHQDSAERLQEARELRRWKESLTEAVLQDLRSDRTVDARTLEVFFAYAVNHESAPDVAARYELKENAVYQIKNRLMRKVQLRVAQLLKESGSP
jgi:RNA polymerase sigma-70 factor (ECF subfamily)